MKTSPPRTMIGKFVLFLLLVSLWCSNGIGKVAAAPDSQHGIDAGDIDQPDPATLTTIMLSALPARSSQAEALEEARLLMGEGDRLKQSGNIVAAREQWQAAVAQYETAGDALGAADAYLRLADSLQTEAIFDRDKLRQAINYYLHAITAATDTYELLILKELDFDQTTLQQANKLYDDGEAAYHSGDCTEAIPKLTDARQHYAAIDFGSGEARALALIAVCQLEGGRYFNSLTTLLDALWIAQGLPLGSSQTERYLEAQHKYEEGDLNGAFTIYQEILPKYQDIQDTDSVAQVMLNMGAIYAQQGRFPEAKEQLEEAKKLFILLKNDYDEYNEAAARHNLANIAVMEGRYAEATTEFQAAINLWWQIGDPAHRTISLSGLALAHNGLSDFETALEVLQTAEDLAATLPPDLVTEGDLINNRAVVAYSLGDYDQALHLFEQALSVRKTIQGPQRAIKEAESLSNIAAVQASLGQFDTSLATYEAVLNRFGQAAPFIEAQAVANMASVYIQRGDYQQGIAHYLKALNVFTRHEMRPITAGLLQNLAAAYISIGDLSEGEKRLQEALMLFEEMDDRARVAAIENNLGLLFVQLARLEATKEQRLDRFARAKDHLDRARSIWQELGDDASMVKTTQNLALIAAGQEDYAEALSLTEEALLHSESANLYADRARILFLMSALLLTQEDYQAAIDRSEKALTVAADTGDAIAEIGSHMTLAIAHRATGEVEIANRQIETALARFEELQGAITVTELKSAFLGNLADIYDLAIIMALEQGQDEKAFNLTEQARARALLDQLTNQRIDVRATGNPELVQQEQDLRQQLGNLYDQLTLEKTKSATPPNDALLNNLATEIEQTHQILSRVQTELKVTNPEYVSIVAASTISLTQIQRQVLDEQTTLITYYVLDGPPFDKVAAWVIDQDKSQFVPLSINRETLETNIDFVRQSFAAKDDNDWDVEVDNQPFATLYDELFAPLLPFIKHNHLVIIPHDVLHYLPFAALWDAEQEEYLADRYTIRYAPSATALQFIQPQKPVDTPQPLVIGNPDASLPFATEEAVAVAELYNSKPILRREATEAVLRSRSAQADILHIAAHGLYEPINPMYSRIELAPAGGYDGRLEVHEIYGLDLKAANLVVLSACDTSVGMISRGDEVASLNRAFLAAGAPAVVTSLWPVDDAASGALMVAFHENLRAGVHAAQALQRAQMTVRSEAAWASPYYWAAFSLTGADILFESN